MQAHNHWEKVYTTRSSTEVSWFQEHAVQSLALIRSAGVGRKSGIIDIGGGASTLVDDLLGEGYANITVLDISAAALATSKGRLGERSGQVSWIAGDITQLDLPANTYSLWHDRAVFHFLTQAADRRAYVQALVKAVAPGGHIVIATFAEDGPEKCSGLPVVRYSAAALQKELGSAATLLGHTAVTHVTPSGTDQKFIYCLFGRRAQAE